MSLNQTFTVEQKEYLAGFFAGANQRGFNPFAGVLPNGQITASSESGATSLAEETVYGTPVEDLCKEERWKHEKNGLDCYEDILAYAAKNELPKDADMFRFKFFGLFNVSPVQNSLMLRCRIPGGTMLSHQLEGMADMAEDWAGGYADLTTRNNLQLREIEPKNASNVINKMVSLGLGSKGAGADNLRNLTMTPTAGFDPDEMIDVRPFIDALNHTILNSRNMFGLPRKFNISFDGGGAISVCSDTNDIAFYAVRVGEGEAVEPGVYFRVQLAGITGHKQFAKDSGILVRPEQAVAVAVAIVKTFVENGNRENRKKSRLKYLIDDWGIEKFVEETEKNLDFDFVKFPKERCEGRRPIRRQGHLGVHPQKEEGLNYIGVSFPVGRMLPEQMRGIAAIARKYGRGEVRLTVWQNLLIPYISDADLDTVKNEIVALGLHYERNWIQGGLVACTGSNGCKFASANTKGNTLELGEYLSKEIELDQPINIHTNGCHHSCAQHYVGDIGLKATKVKVDGQSVDGYGICFGGGVDDEQGIAQEVFQGVPFEEVKPLVKRALEVYKERRNDGESFVSFNRRHDADTLRAMYATEAVAS